MAEFFPSKLAGSYSISSPYVCFDICYVIIQEIVKIVFAIDFKRI